MDSDWVGLVYLGLHWTESGRTGLDVDWVGFGALGWVALDWAALHRGRLDWLRVELESVRSDQLGSHCIKSARARLDVDWVGLVGLACVGLDALSRIT